MEEKHTIYDNMKCEWDMHSAGNLAMCLGDFNGHIGRHVEFSLIDFVHGGYGAGQRNFEGRMLLEFCLSKQLYVSNTWPKREEKRKATFKWEKMRQKLTLSWQKKKTDG